MADTFQFSWATVQHDDNHPLAADSDDEKCLEKAKKEAERASARRKRDTGAGGKRRRNWTDTAELSIKRGPAITQPTTPPPLRQPRPRVLAPCYRCGGFVRLAASCLVKDKTVYPLCQPVAGSAEMSVESSS